MPDYDSLAPRPRFCYRILDTLITRETTKQFFGGKTSAQCYAPTNKAKEEAKHDFYKQLQAVMEQVPLRDVKIVTNAKVGTDNTGR